MKFDFFFFKFFDRIGFFIFIFFNLHKLPKKKKRFWFWLFILVLILFCSRCLQQGMLLMWIRLLIFKRGSAMPSDQAFLCNLPRRRSEIYENRGIFLFVFSFLLFYWCLVSICYLDLVILVGLISIQVFELNLILMKEFG